MTFIIITSWFDGGSALFLRCVSGWLDSNPTIHEITVNMWASGFWLVASCLSCSQHKTSQILIVHVEPLNKAEQRWWLTVLKNLLPLQTDAALGYLAAAAHSAWPRESCWANTGGWKSGTTHSDTHTNHNTSWRLGFDWCWTLKPDIKPQLWQFDGKRNRCRKM